MANNCCCLSKDNPKRKFFEDYHEMLEYFHKHNAWVDGEPFYGKNSPWGSNIDWDKIPYPWYPPQPHHHCDPTEYVPDWSRPADNVNCAFANMAWWMWQQWNIAPWLYASLHGMPNCPNVPMPEYQYPY